jgi:hypothetical protein
MLNDLFTNEQNREEEEEEQQQQQQINKNNLHINKIEYK